MEKKTASVAGTGLLHIPIVRPTFCSRYPDIGYYDDNSVDVTVTGVPTDSGSGVTLAEKYLFRTDVGSYGSIWLTGGTTLTSVTEGSRIIYVLIRDNCGNNATDLDSIPVVVDTTNPTGYSSTIFEINNIHIFMKTGVEQLSISMVNKIISGLILK